MAKKRNARWPNLDRVIDLSKAAAQLHTTTDAIKELRAARKLTPFKINIGGGIIPVVSQREVDGLKQHPRIIARVERAAAGGK